MRIPSFTLVKLLALGAVGCIGIKDAGEVDT